MCVAKIQAAQAAQAGLDAQAGRGAPSTGMSAQRAAYLERHPEDATAAELAEDKTRSQSVIGGDVPPPPVGSTPEEVAANAAQMVSGPNAGQLSKLGKAPGVVDPTDEYIRKTALQAKQRYMGANGIQSTFLLGPAGKTGP